MEVRRVGKCEWWVGVRENEDIFLGDGVKRASLLLRDRGLRWLLGGTGNALI